MRARHLAIAVLAAAAAASGCRSFGPCCFPASKCGRVIELIGQTPSGMPCLDAKTGKFTRCP